MNFPWDELNVIRSKVEKLEIESTEEETPRKSEDGTPLPPKKRYDAEKCIDIVYEWLEMAWTLGVEDVNEMLSTSYAPDSPSMEAEMRSQINRKIAGEDYKERIRKWAEKGDLDAIMRVAETDATRIVNRSAIETARKAGKEWKTWITMDDDKVRPTHVFLHGMTIPINDYFVTFDGDRAQQPGEFTSVENNANCRCKLEFT